MKGLARIQAGIEYGNWCDEMKLKPFPVKVLKNYLDQAQSTDHFLSMMQNQPHEEYKPKTKSTIKTNVAQVLVLLSAFGLTMGIGYLVSGDLTLVGRSCKAALMKEGSDYVLGRKCTNYYERSDR